MSPTIQQVRDSFLEGQASPAEVLQACQQRIRELDPNLHAFITVLEPEPRPFDPALPLSGIPIALKDLFDMAAVPTTAGAEFWRDNIPLEDATVVNKLKQAGAVIIGKTNMHEIALGITNVNPHYGACRNPWDLQRISGGSSGGSAVAVATGMCLAALGSDTGGSIRIPAALCGVVGLKPTFGRISLRGVIPLSWNLDHAGPITKTVRDAASLLQVLAGYDPLDPACRDRVVDNYLSKIEMGVTGWRIGIANGDFFKTVNHQVLAAVQQAGRVFADLGASLQEVHLPWLEQAAQANSFITQADGAAFHRERLQADPQAFGEDVLRRLRAGQAVTSSDCADARRTQVETKRRFKTFFESYDLLLLPTTPDTAPLIIGPDAVEQARRLTRFCAPFNLTGLPALSLPCGFSKSGLPIGLQIVGPEWAEAEVLRAGQAFENATPWHERQPDI